MRADDGGARGAAERGVEAVGDPAELIAGPVRQGREPAFAICLATIPRRPHRHSPDQAGRQTDEQEPQHHDLLGDDPTTPA
ncbi:hypothetical protein WU86_09640, partial [Corynebacterium xerosis]